MDHYIQYAMKDNKIVHISEVESGLACGCYCSHCNAQLVAKKGPIFVHHFAHYNTEQCIHAYETALHAGAKRVLERERSFLFPSVYGKDIFGKDVMIFKPIELPIKEVVLEQFVENIIPDVCINVGDKLCLIEIFVTHKVDATKLKKIEKLGIAAIEIDLSNVDREIDDEFLFDVLIRSENLKKWLFNPKIATWEQKNQLETRPSMSIGNADEFMITYSKFYSDGIFGCPLLTGYKKLRRISAREKCFSCKYLISKSEKSVFCGARFSIWQRTHNKLVSSKRGHTLDQYLSAQKYLESLGVCPKCGNLLVTRDGMSGPFIACSGYPVCDYSRKLNELTNESKHD